MFKKILIKFCFTIDWVVRQAGLLASFIMPVLAFVVAYEVFSRYVLGSPTIWAFDLSLFMFGYLAALGGAYAQQQRAHINVDILYLKVSHKTRCIFNLISFSLAIFFLVVIVMMSWGKYEEAIEFDYRRQSEWAPPMFHFWIMMMVASGLFIAQLARDMLAELYFLLTSTALIEEAQ
ncbi:TRAP transporter small permease [Amphritea sp.]|uniref:TRAP transporter small permease subunit n=1 Tax=Amphritea sp. TaxID=1872502 RepID=UPI0025C0BA44|nr:TRAP transporter small permease [Amphritea sp.]